MIVLGYLTVQVSQQQLDCKLGQFMIEDERLSDLPQGKHEGFFEITGFLPYCCPGNRKGETGTTFTVQVIAMLGKFALLPEEQCTTSVVDFDTNTVKQVSLLPNAKIPLTEVEKEPDAELFGELWPLGQVVKIDPAQDRAVFDKQRLRLKALNYSFDHHAQTWHKKA